MIRPLCAIALLSVSWMAGVNYFHLPDFSLYVLLLMAGVLMLLGTEIPTVFGRRVWILALAAVPAFFVLKGAYFTVPILLIAGVILQAMPVARKWTRALGTSMVFASLILATQAAALFVYAQFTARNHELPGFLANAASQLARLMNIDADYSGVNIGLSTMRRNHLLGATWELLLDPASFCFIVGSVVWLRLQGYCPKKVSIFLLSCFIWIPLRVCILMATLVNSALRTDFDAQLNVMWAMWSVGFTTLILLAAAVVSGSLLRRKSVVEPRSMAASRAGMLLTFAGLFIVTFGIYFDRTGTRAGSRVLVDESHSKWERTDKPFDTTWYGHDAGYNYAVLFDYLSRFYHIDRINDGFSEQALQNCDVLILKTPTLRYGRENIDRIREYVARGGGLLLVGEHTDVFGTGTVLNDLAREFGFEFRYDCLFGIDKKFEQQNEPAIVTHPAVQHVQDHNWAVSCSIDPGFSVGRGVVVSTGLRNLLADYHASNYYPQPEDRAEAHSGSFVQIWSARYGEGRVLAFSDSTQFSNFCLFDPGKSELFLNMVEWCNHRGGGVNQFIIVGLGLILSLCGAAVGVFRKGETFVIAAGILGFSLAIPAVSTLHARALPFPEPAKPLVRVTMDRTICDSPLPLAGFIAGQPDGFGIFEQWILRLGYFTTRASGDAAIKSNLVVFTNPHLDVPRDYRDRLQDYVENGGHVLVIDSPENARSTANSILWPFGIRVRHDSPPASGTLVPPAGWPMVSVNGSCVVEGDGTAPLLKIGDQLVAVEKKVGRGSVTVLGFGSTFTDNNYGYTGDNEPDATLRQAYELQFRLLKRIVEGEPTATQPATAPSGT
jgi:hypothetical protein